MTDAVNFLQLDDLAIQTHHVGSKPFGKGIEDIIDSIDPFGSEMDSDPLSQDEQAFIKAEVADMLNQNGFLKEKEERPKSTEYSVTMDEVEPESNNSYGF